MYASLNQYQSFESEKKEHYSDVIHFTPLHSILHKDMSVFYSFINQNNEIYGYGRKSWKPESRVITKHQLHSFELIPTGIELRGEDPRVFKHNDTIYVVDNYLNDLHLYNTKTNRYIKLELTGKNLSFFTHHQKLYAIHIMAPFQLYEIDVDTGQLITKIDTIHNMSDATYRGGTPGYLWKENQYIGLGHKTYFNPHLIHDVFLWKVDMTDQPKLMIQDLILPSSNSIKDPTSLFMKNRDLILSTAESQKAWFENQDYHTCFYKVDGLELEHFKDNVKSQ